MSLWSVFVGQSVCEQLIWVLSSLSQQTEGSGPPEHWSTYQINSFSHCVLTFPGGSYGKASACSAGDLGSIPGLGRSPGEGNGNPLQYSCLENPMDRGAWGATVNAVARVGHDLATKPSPPPCVQYVFGQFFGFSSVRHIYFSSRFKVALSAYPCH